MNDEERDQLNLGVCSGVYDKGGKNQGSLSSIISKKLRICDFLRMIEATLDRLINSLSSRDLFGCLW